MKTFFTTSILAVTLTAGAFTASADPVLKDLAKKGAIVTTQGITGSR